MQKKLIAMAIGAVVAAAPFVATQADVKLRGKMQVDLVNLDGGDFDNLVEQGDAGGRSRVFIDASKDLGNGLKAISRYAIKINPSNGSDESARDQWVGLKGGWGHLKIGRLPTPYKMNGGVKWDPYAASFMEARRSGGMSGDSTGTNGFINDIIEYGSPKLGSFKFQAGYIADESSGNNGSILFGGTGKFGPVELMAAYQNIKQETGKDDVKQAKVGVRYKANGLIAALQLEDVDKVGSIRVNGHKVTPATTKSGKITFVNLGYKFGNTLIAGNYGKVSADGGGQDIDYLAIGVTYFLNKKVRAVLGYASTDTGTKYKMLGAYLRYDY